MFGDALFKRVDVWCGHMKVCCRFAEMMVSWLRLFQEGAARDTPGPNCETAKSRTKENKCIYTGGPSLTATYLQAPTLRPSDR